MSKDWTPRINDLVRKIGCSAPIRVTRVYQNRLEGRYKKSGIHVPEASLDKFEPYTAPSVSEREPTMSKSCKLFQTLEETPRFGSFLCLTQKGLTALEMKPSGDVETFKPEDIEEVTPYTIRCVGTGSITRIFSIPSGMVAEGDIIQCDGYPELLMVLKLNTKDHNHTPFSGWKVAKERIV